MGSSVGDLVSSSGNESNPPFWHQLSSLAWVLKGLGGDSHIFMKRLHLVEVRFVPCLHGVEDTSAGVLRWSTSEVSQLVSWTEPLCKPEPFWFWDCP